MGKLEQTHQQRFWRCVFWGILGGALFLGGWIAAHNEVARECERQGNFYVGDATYLCGAQHDQR